MMLSKRLWAVLLTAVLVAGLLVGFGDGDDAVAKEPRATWRRVMVPAAALIPTTPDWDYINHGNYITMTSGSGQFAVPLSFPVPVVNIRKITLIAADNTASASVCVALYRAQPLSADEEEMGTVCTYNRAAIPQTVSRTALLHRRVNTANHGPYLWVNFGKGVTFYGVQVTYSH